MSSYLWRSYLSFLVYMTLTLRRMTSKYTPHLHPPSFVVLPAQACICKVLLFLMDQLKCHLPYGAFPNPPASLWPVRYLSVDIYLWRIFSVAGTVLSPGEQNKDSYSQGAYMTSFERPSLLPFYSNSPPNILLSAV